MPEVRLVRDAEELAQAAAGLFVSLAKDIVVQQGRFVVALSGGSTPRRLYTLLASPQFASQVDWGRVHFFWGDERCVPPDDPQSNYRMVRETLLDHIAVPPSNVHRIAGEALPHEAADAYEVELRRFFGDVSVPQFNLVLLGLGEEGHTASLFPSSPALYDKSRWVRAVYVSSLSAWRVTLTPRAINAADRVVFLVSGASKASILERVLAGPRHPCLLPAQVIRPRKGRLWWIVDQAAAARLPAHLQVHRSP